MQKHKSEIPGSFDKFLIIESRKLLRLITTNKCLITIFNTFSPMLALTSQEQNHLTALKLWLPGTESYTLLVLLVLKQDAGRLWQQPLSTIGVGYMRVSSSVILLFLLHNNFSFLGIVSRFPFQYIFCCAVTDYIISNLCSHSLIQQSQLSY